MIFANHNLSYTAALEAGKITSIYRILSANGPDRQDFLARGLNHVRREVVEAPGVGALALKAGAARKPQAHHLVAVAERPGAPGGRGAEQGRNRRPQGRGQVHGPGVGGDG